MQSTNLKKLTTVGMGLGMAGMVGCPQTPQTKEITFAVYGEEFIEDQIPAEETDGWAITFDKFLVVLGDVSVSRGGEELASDPIYRVFDLSKGSSGAGFIVTELSAETERGVHDVSYRIASVPLAVAANASAADVAFMAANEFAVYVEVKASRGADAKSLTLGFENPTTYTGCFTTIDFDDENNARVELTIHGDHLFYEDLGDDPAVRFDAIAATDTDDDGVISEAEIAVAADPSGEKDRLLELIEELVAGLGHIDGEGHCADAVGE